MAPKLARAAAAVEWSRTRSAKAAKVVLFYLDKEGCPYREFSNFYRHASPYEYVLPPFARRPGFPNSLSCLFSEKAIMATKAAMMGDLEMFQAIAEAPDPKSCKALGRGVRNFDEELWTKHLEEVAFEVVLQKFRAEPQLRRLLLSTGAAILAEAAPNDRIWGVGLGMKDERAKDPAQWQGRNVLGSALMRARDHLSGARADEAALASEAADAAGSAAATVAAPEAGAPVRGEDAAGGDTAAAAAAAPEAGAPAWRAGTAGGSAAAAAAAPEEQLPLPRLRPNRWRSERALEEALQQAMQEELQAALQEARKEAPQEAEAPVERADVAGASIFDCYAVLDFEATCEEERKVRPQEVIEFPLVLLDARTGEPVGEFRTYVRPVHRPCLSEFCTQLTGIVQADVDEAPSWSAALQMAQAWLDDRLAQHGFRSCAFVTCGDWDLKTMIVEQCGLSGEHVPARFRRWINIKNLFRRLTGASAGGMPDMLKHLRLELEGRHHSGLDDCRNIARILQQLLRRGSVLESDVSSIDPSAAAAARKAGGRSGKGRHA